MRARAAWASLAALALLGPAGLARAALPQQSGAVDLLFQANVRVDGVAANDTAGAAVAGAGDVNGDGRADLIVGARGADDNGRENSGSAYVVFGQPSAGPVDLAALGAGGFRIDGAAAGDTAGDAVAGAGDVNGDGRADVIVGAPNARNNGRASSGSAYVVFGRSGADPVDLAALGAGGFRIDGASAGETAGDAVAGAGDVNGDGRADLVVGALRAGNNGRAMSGSAYVVFGRPSADPVDLAALGTGGFRIDGATAGERAGNAVAGAGDVNGDGRADLVVGAPGAGSAHVVFGRPSADPVDLAALGEGGFRINEAAALDGAGDAVAGAGDVNGDGRADVVVGAPVAGNNGRVFSGSVYVVFGQPGADPVNLAALGAGGFRIDGAAAGDRAGSAVAGAGDVNGDGRTDLLVGARGADNHGRENAGSAHLVFGRPSADPVDLAALGEGGFRIDGAAARDAAGAVAAAGDVNGDGRADVVVGAPDADNNGRVYSGSAYVVLGFGAPELSYPALGASAAGVPIAPLVPTLRRTGPASFQVAPALPAGLALDPASGVVSGTPRAGFGPGELTVTMSDLTGQISAPLGVRVAGGRGRAAGAAPRLSGARATCRRAPRRVRKHACRIVLSFRLSGAAQVRVTVGRLGPRPRRALGSLRRAGRPRANRILLPARLGRRALGPGRYRLTLTARRDGLTGRPLRLGVRVRVMAAKGRRRPRAAAAAAEPKGGQAVHTRRQT